VLLSTARRQLLIEEFWHIPKKELQKFAFYLSYTCKNTGTAERIVTKFDTGNYIEGCRHFPVLVKIEQW
jgi:hypothetical protein